MQTELTKKIIERAFDEMGTLAAGRGITIEIAVYRGSRSLSSYATGKSPNSVRCHE